MRGDAGFPVRLRFTERGKVRWISHRDVARAFERAFRIEQLPLAFSQGFSPRPKVSLTWPMKPPHEKHQPSPTPYHAMPHFTERFKSGKVLAARASTDSAMPRCGCARLRI